MRIITRHAPWALASLFLAVLLAGCGSDELSGGEKVVTEETVTVIIDADTDAPDVPWTLEGPGGFSESGAGDRTLRDLEPGRWGVTWGPVAGWWTPEPEVATIDGTKRYRFVGRYYTDEVDADPTWLTITPTVVNPGGLEEDWYSFVMGSPEDEPGRGADEDERPTLLNSGYLLTATEITNAQFLAAARWALDNGHVTLQHDPVRERLRIRDNLDGATVVLMDLYADASFVYDLDRKLFGTSHPDRPVTGVTWYGAAAFCDWLSLQEGATRAYDHTNWRCNDNAPYDATGYRLPTEAEWEHACRAGTAAAFGDLDAVGEDCDEANLDPLGWYCGNAGGRSHDVGSLAANGWDLHDMHGNVWEWCNDRHDDYPPLVPVYETDEFGDPVLDENGDPIVEKYLPLVDPVGPPTNENPTRVLRGGSWLNLSRLCRAAERTNELPDYLNAAVGFRAARTAPAP